MLSQEKHLETANCCPSISCQSIDIEGGHITIEGKIAWQKVSCNKCDYEWNDIYTKTSYEVIKQPHLK